MIAALTLAAVIAAPLDYRARQPQDEVIYLIMPDRFDNADPSNDRGGLKGDRLRTGFDPTNASFYHGGDLKGIIRQLDYIQGLGATAIWLTPVLKNKSVQGPPGQETAGYHGYWITDFTHIDPHLGTDADYKALLVAAHARGMKVFMDIVVNHTADVIQYRECNNGMTCAYRNIADYPYRRRGGIDGAPINGGFTGEEDQSPKNFAKLTDPDYAYTVFVPPAERNEKVPAWLNDPTYYHNRGNSMFRGESSTMGDFFGLDDLFTENPRVVSGMIQIYGKLIDDYGIDGFRVDTEQHVDPAFWRQFVPAMRARARARGIPDFYIFGEAQTDDMDPAHTAVRTRVDNMPAFMDYPFRRAIVDVVAAGAATDELAKLFDADPLYRGGAGAALEQATFTGNYDAGRIAYFIRKANPDASDAELLKRDALAHAMLLTLRGVPVIYYGDEQGFAGHGGDLDSRQDMFPSRVASYNDNKLIGTSATTAQSNFNPSHPLYREISKLAHIRTSHPALTRGLQTIRFSSAKPGLFAVSRFDPENGREMLLLFNTSRQPIEQNLHVETRSLRFDTLAGTCPAAESAPGTVHIALPPFGYAVCDAN
jgi:glycosidase